MEITCYFCQTLVECEFSWQILEKYSDVKFHENLFSGNWVVSFGKMVGQTDGRTDSKTDMTKPIVAFSNFMKATKNRVEEELRDNIPGW